MIPAMLLIFVFFAACVVGFATAKRREQFRAREQFYQALEPGVFE